MLQPKRTKFREAHNGHMRGTLKAGTQRNLGERRLNAMRPERVTARQTLSTAQLGDELLKLKKEQFNLRFQRATGQLENTARVRQVRRDIARIQTVARQKRAATK